MLAFIVLQRLGEFAEDMTSLQQQNGERSRLTPGQHSPVAIVTGASAGIGRVITKRLSAAGYRIVAAARSEQKLAQLQAELQKNSGVCECIITDVCDPNDLERLVKFAIEQFGRIDVLVNNAGVDCFSEFANVSTEQVLQTIEVNLTGSILLTRLVVPQMLSQKSGCVINMASTAGKHGPAYGAVYAATKAGLVGFSQGLRGELLSSGINVTAICPGFTTNGGIYDRIVSATGKGTSSLMGSTSAEKVADAVMKAIRTGAPELIVNWPPMRPIFVLREMFPRLGEKIILLATKRFLRRAATAAKTE